MEVSCRFRRKTSTRTGSGSRRMRRLGRSRPSCRPDRKVRAYKYIVFATRDGNYIVARWLEIEQLAAASGQDIRGTPIGMLKGLPKPVIGIEQNSMGLSSARRGARRAARQAPGDPFERPADRAADHRDAQRGCSAARPVRGRAEAAGGAGIEDGPAGQVRQPLPRLPQRTCPSAWPSRRYARDQHLVRWCRAE